MLDIHQTDSHAQNIGTIGSLVILPEPQDRYERSEKCCNSQWSEDMPLAAAGILGAHIVDVAVDCSFSIYCCSQDYLTIMSSSSTTPSSDIS